MFGWFYTATPQECSGCGRTDQAVRATTRRCLPCDGVDLKRLQELRRPSTLHPLMLAMSVGVELVSAAVWVERPGPCAECARLREQARAAVLTGDRSRLSDVRVLQQRHRIASHGQAERSHAS
jgi:hypothetical protein